jgi:hypothetical protein
MHNKFISTFSPRRWKNLITLFKKSKTNPEEIQNKYGRNTKIIGCTRAREREGGAQQIHFHISGGTLEKSDHSESDRKLIRAHWLVGEYWW